MRSISTISAPMLTSNQISKRIAKTSLIHGARFVLLGISV
jgi:hypothetical protein